MENKNGITITTRDRLLKAWDNVTELTRNFEYNSKNIKDDERAAELFARCAEDQGANAAKFLELLHEYEIE